MGGENVTDYYNLGSFERPVSTQSADAQTWFNRGLIWTYAFNHGEAAACFQKAILSDRGCAMAYWGLAFCLGPNYNKPWEIFDEADFRLSIERAHKAAADALLHATAASPTEQALIEAIQSRYPKSHPVADCSAWNHGYVHIMRSVYHRYPNDLDVAALFADALMNLTPWALWDIHTGKPKEGAHTLEAKEVLETALNQDQAQEHPGLLHLYIHLMEMSDFPESALAAGDSLRGLVPDAGHLHHMPTHIDILCGDYQRAIASNTDAILADSVFCSRAGAMNFYTLYRLHNYHFRIYAALFSGQSSIALNTVAQLEASVPESLLRVKSPPMADWLEGFLAMRVHALIRFGRWQDIFNLLIPEDADLYCVTIAMTHYAKSLAFAVTNDIPSAESSRLSFHAAVKRVPKTRMLFNNTCLSILAIASSMLDGEISYRQRNFPLAFAQLSHAITLDDSLPYDEPWSWMQPTRHAYGALRLERGDVEEALKVYQVDLGISKTLPRAMQHPGNVWALHGLHECLERLGRLEEASSIKGNLDSALALADVKITGSCFCRGAGGPIELGCQDC